MVRTWDLSAGLCGSSLHIPIKGTNYAHLVDAQLVDGRLIFVWYSDGKIHIWDTKNNEHLQAVDAPHYQNPKVTISGDGSKVFLLGHTFIQAWSIWIGEASGEVRLEGEPLFNSLIVDTSRIWLCSKDLQTQGWDSGTPSSSPTPSPNHPPSKPHMDFINGTMEQPAALSSRFRNTVSGKVVFWLSGRYERPNVAQWDGRYLVAGYESGEVLILDFIHLIPQ